MILYRNNSIIFGNIIKSVYHGIRLDHSDNTIVSHNNASECIFGINGFYSSNCSISDNIVNSNSWYGIIGTELDNCKLENNVANLNDFGIFLEASSNCKLKKNVANSNTYGLYVIDSNNCTIDNNIANLNSYCGISLWLSSNNIITGNTLDAAIGSTDYGIRIESTSVNNEITENNISNNIVCGMYLDYSPNNEIYHNNFINNDKQAYDHHGFNDWDKGQIIGGNYWSDHNCTGNPSNGTEPYTKIDTNAGAVDNYPFEDPDGWVKVEEVFDTGYGTYSSIMGNHTGIIKPNYTVIATKLYTYPCEGTGGHTEYAEIRNATWNATATWKGYAGDWHNVTFDKTVVLLANETYNYTIRTGSYPQIHHTDNLEP